MTPRRYASSDEGKSKAKLFRLTPSNETLLAATSKDANISENAIVNAALAQYWGQAASATYTAAPLATNSVSSYVTSSVDNYSETIATARSSIEDAINKLSGKPVEEEPHA